MLWALIPTAAPMSAQMADDHVWKAFRAWLQQAPPLAGPVVKQPGGREIKVREAYDRDFERYLIRGIFERLPRIVAPFLASERAKVLPLENRMVAALALEAELMLGQLSHGRGLLQKVVVDAAEHTTHPGIELGAGEFMSQEIHRGLSLLLLHAGNELFLAGDYGVGLRDRHLLLADSDVTYGELAL